MKDQSIRQKLITVILLTTSIVLLLTCAAFIIYEWITFRQAMARNLTTLAQITAANSTAALAFQNEADATEVLSALRVEDHVVAAAFYDHEGKLFATYPAGAAVSLLPSTPGRPGYRFSRSHLVLFQPVIANDKRLGTLYLKSDLGAMYDRFQLYGGIVGLVLGVSSLVAFAISTKLQKRISEPILALADTAKAVSARKDYSVRAPKQGEDELGLLTDAFNHMLNQIQAQNSALQESEARKGAILESAHDGIISIDHRGLIIEFNPAAQRIFGYTREQAIGKELAEFIVPAHLREGHRRGLEHYLATGEGPVLNKRVELPAIRADGTEFPAEVSITRVGSAAPPTFTGFVRDITERKRAEQELGKSEAQLRLIWENVMDGMRLTDQDGIIRMVNEAYCRLVEKPREALEGQPLSVLYEAHSEEEVMRKHRQRFQERLVQAHYEKEVNLWNGKRVFLEISNSFLDVEGRPALLVSIFRNITERKQAEEEIIRLNASLEERVTDRTAQLEAANKELEAFSYSVSHDLRAPLRGIDGYARILSEDYEPMLDAEGRRVLGVIQTETRRMGRLIDELLNFSRLGRQQMNSTTLDMTALTKGAFEEVARDVERKPQFELKPLPPTRGDEALIRQVLVNLLSNAVKFTRHQEAPMIEVGSQSDSDQNLYYVKDNGVGFDAKYANKLFGVFQRLHREDEFEGTGVGLALVQRILHRHGGNIWAEAKLNEGATFYFTLPKEKEQP